MTENDNFPTTLEAACADIRPRWALRMESVCACQSRFSMFENLLDN